MAHRSDLRLNLLQMALVLLDDAEISQYLKTQSESGCESGNCAFFGISIVVIPEDVSSENVVVGIKRDSQTHSHPKMPKTANTLSSHNLRVTYSRLSNGNSRLTGVALRIYLLRCLMTSPWQNVLSVKKPTKSRFHSSLMSPGKFNRVSGRFVKNFSLRMHALPVKANQVLEDIRDLFKPLLDARRFENLHTQAEAPLDTYTDVETAHGFITTRTLRTSNTRFRLARTRTGL